MPCGAQWLATPTITLHIVVGDIVFPLFIIHLPKLNPSEMFSPLPKFRCFVQVYYCIAKLNASNLSNKTKQFAQHSF